MTAGDERLGGAAQRVVDAWTVEGPMPVLHRVAQDRLRREWPVLAEALERLAVAAQIETPMAGLPTIPWALQYAQHYWTHGREPLSQAALHMLAQEIRSYPWAVENRVVYEPVYALFREREDADEMVEASIDLRVIPNPRTSRG